MCDCAPDRGPLIDTYQHPEWGTMHVHRKDEPWWNEGVLFRKAGGPPGEVACDLATEDAEFIAKARNSFPALLKLARAWLVERGGPSNEALDALNELADAVLGPAPTPEEHRAP